MIIGEHRQARIQLKLSNLPKYGVLLLLSLLLTACGGDSESEQTSGSSGDGSNSDLAGDTTTLECVLTAEEQAMLQQVNTARSQPRVCGTTNYTAAAPLKWDCKLQQAALGHSRDMAENDFFDHTGSNGLGPGFRIAQEGYQARTWGENIAAGYTTIESVIAAWLLSPGHCQNLMQTDFTDLGMAYVEASGSTYGIYWTQVFATPTQQNTQSFAPLQTPSGQLGGTEVVRTHTVEP